MNPLLMLDLINNKKIKINKGNNDKINFAMNMLKTKDQMLSVYFNNLKFFEKNTKSNTKLQKVFINEKEVNNSFERGM